MPEGHWWISCGFSVTTEPCDPLNNPQTAEGSCGEGRVGFICHWGLPEDRSKDKGRDEVQDEGSGKTVIHSWTGGRRSPERAEVEVGRLTGHGIRDPETTDASGTTMLAAGQSDSHGGTRDVLSQFRVYRLYEPICRMLLGWGHKKTHRIK